jgi:RimJ/RimL family protein N-acetyltransferase
MELPAPQPPQTPGPSTGLGPGDVPDAGRDEGPEPGDGVDPTADTVDLDLSGRLATLVAERGAHPGPVRRGRPAGRGGGHLTLRGPDLLDGIADWPAATTPCGMFQLVPVRVERDLPLVAAWMNDPVVAEFWELSGPAETAAAHLRAQLDGDGRSVPCLGVLDGVPMSYWEIYRADLDPLARHYPARPHDTGIHLLVGGAADRGRGTGTSLLRAVGDLILHNRPGCRRVLAEPDLRNVPSVAAFLGAGFRFSAEVDLPGKRAALMIRDR